MWPFSAQTLRVVRLVAAPVVSAPRGRSAVVDEVVGLTRRR